MRNVLAWLAAMVGLAAFLSTAGTVLLGWQPLIVSSASMAPSIPKGSIIVMEPVAGGRVDVGDVVTYRLADRTITHRIVGVAAGAAPAFITRGDSNGNDDPLPVPLGAIEGRVLYHVPALGYGFAYLGAAMTVTLLLPFMLVSARSLWRFAEILSD